MVEVCVFCEADIDGSHLHHTYVRDLWSTPIRYDAMRYNATLKHTQDVLFIFF